MRQSLLMMVSLCILPIIGSDTPKDYDDKTELSDIDGTWQLVESGSNGQTFIAIEEIKTFRGHAFTTECKVVHVATQGRFFVDSTRKPGHLDEIPTNGPCKGQKLRFIYQINADTLMVGVRPNNNTVRPKEFDEDDISVCIYKRIK